MNDPIPSTGLSRPPTPFEVGFDRVFRGLTRAVAWFVIGLVFLIVFQIASTARPAIQAHGFDFLTTSKWDPGKKVFGIVPQIGGTLYSSGLGVLIGSIFGVTVAIFITQDFLPLKVEIFIKNVVELLAAIPSVVYGLWGIFVVIPTIRPICNWLNESLGMIPFFGTRLAGPGMLPASLVLAIMVLPTVTAISRDAIVSVPPKLREAAFGLGATLWETILAVILPTAARGIFGSIILAFGRAVGETMALAMLLGNNNSISWSLFSPGNTLAALLANQWPESSHTEKGALMYAGLVLLGITLLINIVGTVILQRAVRGRIKQMNNPTDPADGIPSNPSEKLPESAPPSAAPTKHALKPGLGHAMGVAGGIIPAVTTSTVTTTARPERPLELERQLRKPRTLFSLIMSIVAGIMSFLAMIPLVSVLIMLIWRGGQRLSISLFTQLPPAAGMPEGGIGNALLGTMFMIGIASALGVPIGILAAIFLAEFSPKGKTSSAVRFVAKILSGLPSVLAGLFSYAAVVILTGRYSAPAGGVALAILMLPTVLLTAEQAIKMVPQRMRDAAIGMGCTQTQVVWHVVLPTALPGVLTGVMLAVARAAGETAPLLFTALFSDYWLTMNPMEPTPSLAVLIFDFSSSPFKNQIEIAWAASLVLVVLVLVANVAAQLWTLQSTKK